MIKMEAIAQPPRFESAKVALFESGYEFTVELLPNLKREMVQPPSPVLRAVETLLKSAKTGKMGDGKIFLSRIENSIGIRNKVRGESPR